MARKQTYNDSKPKEANRKARKRLTQSSPAGSAAEDASGATGEHKSRIAKKQTRPRRSRSKPAMIRKMIRRIEERMDKEEMRATLGDFIRLLQLEQELEEQKPREIRVKWVEPAEGGSVSGT